MIIDRRPSYLATPRTTPSPTCLSLITHHHPHPVVYIHSAARAEQHAGVHGMMAVTSFRHKHGGIYGDQTLWQIWQQNVGATVDSICRCDRRSWPRRTFSIILHSPPPPLACPFHQAADPPVLPPSLAPCCSDVLKHVPDGDRCSECMYIPSHLALTHCPAGRPAAHPPRSAAPRAREPFINLHSRPPRRCPENYLWRRRGDGKGGWRRDSRGP